MSIHEYCVRLIMKKQRIKSGEWQETGKKKKKLPQQNSDPTPLVNNKSDTKLDRERGESRDRGDNAPRRGARNAPPRLSRGGSANRNWKGREEEENEKNRENNRDFSRDRPERGERGRGRGRGSVARGRGGRGRGGFGSRSGGSVPGSGGARFDKGPEIDTWTNEVAENAEKGNSNWADSIDNWDEEWTGNLSETQVFTPSASAAVSTNTFSASTASSMDAFSSAAMTTADVTANSVFSSNSPSIRSGDGYTRLDLDVLLPKQTQDASLSTTSSLGVSSLGSSTGLMVNSTVGVPSSLGAGGSSQSQFYQSQFAKQATESIKNAVGIGSSQPNAIPQPSPVQQQQRPGNAAQAAAAQAAAQAAALQQQRNKPQRTKLPPPSKIPASAVEMPYLPGSNMMPLDVQFGSLDIGDSLSFGSVADPAIVSSYKSSAMSSSSSLTNHLSGMVTKSTENSALNSTLPSSGSTTTSNMSNLDQTRSSVFQNTMTSPNKDYSQTPKVNSPPEPIPFPASQSTNKTSPLMGSRRSGQGTDSLSATTTSPSINYGQSSYSSSYSTANYVKGLNSTTSGYSHPNSNLSSQYGHSSYPGSGSFQSQTGYGGSQSGGYQNQSGYDRESGSSYQSAYSQAGSYGSSQTGGYSRDNQSSSYQSGGQYQSGSGSFQPTISQSGSSYQSSSNQQTSYPNQSGSVYQPSSSSTHSSAYQRDSQSAQTGYGSQSYSSTNQQTNKFAESIAKAGNKETDLDSGRQSAPSSHSFDRSNGTTVPGSMTTTTITTTSTLPSVNTSVSAALGINTTSVSSLSTKPSATTNKAPPNLPPGVTPVLGANYMVQPGMPFIGLQQPMYSYEDLQAIQRGIPTLNLGYYDMSSFATPSTMSTGREQTTASLASMSYAGAGVSDGKMNRVDAQSPIQGTQTTPQQTQGHQQTIFNPATFPPGYGFYYPTPGMVPGVYTPTVYPAQMPQVTNAAHVGTTAATAQFPTAATAQFQKAAGGYGSHTYGTGRYDDLNQGQDFKTAYGGVSQSQPKASVGSPSVTSASSITDLSGAAYSKSFEKQGFHGTPPPFNTLLSGGTQGGPIGAPATAYAATPFMPMMTHQGMLHPLQQDTSGTGRISSSQQSNVQPKGVPKTYNTYWAN
ncbi:protein lingerer [Lingula anatina]|uniref:Protein lingerer n=1 Tax=Lingula anatina TaxID=7574 RepID=A0A1S3H6R1_LINAN|nr:protein lingerer [Lingula anatina]|eukprot:XP_013381667.1 protein lingerer [Lingula anatina]